MQFLIIDDHSIVREWLKDVFLASFRGAEILEAKNSQEALSCLPKRKWDAILLDLNLPDRNGLDLLKDLRISAPRSPILVLSGRPEEEVGQLAMEGGAAGFITKSASVEEIKLALNRVIAGKKYISTELAAAIFSRPGDRLDQPPHQLLSIREFDVLRLLGLGFTPTEISRKLMVSIKTVSTYRVRVLEKLGLKNTAGLIRYAVIRQLVD